jgi:hypothetical protein
MTAMERNAETEDLLNKHPRGALSLYLAMSGDSGAWVNGVYFAETDLFTLVLALEQRSRTLAVIR